MIDPDRTILSLKPGDTLVGRYLLETFKTRGAMGEIHIAKDLHLDKIVALKFLPPELVGDVNALNRLKAEAKHGQELSHPAIAKLYDYQQDPLRSNMGFLIMEYVDGEDLRKLLLEHPTGFPVDQVLKWAQQLAEGIDYAHKKGVLHRDIKPANIMIDDQDDACLIDFGIGREIRSSMSVVSQRADTSGTPAYMSPQQIMGDKLEPLNQCRNDIYSLAATLYEAFCGHPPFCGDGHIQTQILCKPAVPIEGVPDHINNALLAGLAKEPESRPETATQLIQMFAESSEEEVVSCDQDEQLVLPQQERSVGDAQDHTLLCDELLTEAIQVAEEIVDVDHRKYALRDIGATQVEMGYFDEARNTAEMIMGTRLELDILAEFCKAKTNTGDIHEAKRIVAQIKEEDQRQYGPVREKRNVYYNTCCLMVEILAEAGDIEGAQSVFMELSSCHQQTYYSFAAGSMAAALVKAGDHEGANMIASETRDFGHRAKVFGHIAEAQLENGDSVGARSTIAEALNDVDRVQITAEDDGLSLAVALGHIAASQIIMGDFDGAKHTVGKMEEEWQGDTHEDIASYQAKSGSIHEALQSAGEIKEILYRDGAFENIAAVQAKAGDIKGANRTAWRIDDGQSRSQILSIIVAAQAMAGDIEGAISAVTKIEKESCKATALGTISVAQAKFGDCEGSRSTYVAAMQIIEEVEGELVKGWALIDIAIAQATAGDVEGARMTASQIPSLDTRATALVMIAKVVFQNTVKKPVQMELENHENPLAKPDQRPDSVLPEVEEHNSRSTSSISTDGEIESDYFSGLIEIDLNIVALKILPDMTTAIVGGDNGDMVAVDLRSGVVLDRVQAENSTKKNPSRGENHYQENAYFFMELAKDPQSVYTMSHSGVLKTWKFDGSFHLISSVSILSDNRSALYDCIQKASCKSGWSTWSCYSGGVPDSSPSGLVDAKLSSDGSCILCLTELFTVFRCDFSGKLLDSPVVISDTFNIEPATDDAVEFYAGRSQRRYGESVERYSFQTGQISGIEVHGAFIGRRGGITSISRIFLHCGVQVVDTERSKVIDAPEIGFGCDHAPLALPDEGLVLFSNQSKIRVLNTNSLLPDGEPMLAGLPGLVRCVDVMNDKSHLVSAGKDTLRVWDFKSRRPVGDALGQRDTIRHGLSEIGIMSDCELGKNTVFSPMQNDKAVVYDFDSKGHSVIDTKGLYIGGGRGSMNNDPYLLSLTKRLTPRTGFWDRIRKEPPHEAILLRQSRLVSGGLTEVGETVLFQEEDSDARCSLSIGAGKSASVDLGNGRAAILAGGHLAVYDTDSNVIVKSPIGISRNGAASWYNYDVLRVTPDQSKLITCGREKPIRVWNAESLEQIAVFPNSSSGSDCLIPWIDSKHLIYNKNGNLVLATMSSPSQSVALCESPGWGATGLETAMIFGNGTLLATCERDLVVVRDLVTGETIPEPLARHSDTVRSVHLCPDGRTAMTTSSDGTARFWSLESYLEGRSLDPASVLSRLP